MHAVYVVQAVPDGLVKIGKTTNFKVRLRSLRANTGLDLVIVKLYEFKTSHDATVVEKCLHEGFKKYHSPQHSSREWFTPDILPKLPTNPSPEKAESWLLYNYEPYKRRTGRIWSQRQEKFIFVPGYRGGGRYR